VDLTSIGLLLWLSLEFLITSQIACKMVDEVEWISRMRGWAEADGYVVGSGMDLVSMKNMFLRAPARTALIASWICSILYIG